ncbi:MAG TPA: tripartite tricarboxylate transporter TctB family protein [Burkholderiales bacterium]|nr:tripartite tricarboxylate transporter TctB family protein [Burkholderiales bacterium]
MEEGTRRSGDLWSGVALALLGLFIVVQAWQWDYLGAEGPGAGFFPLWYGLAMLALSLLLVVSSLRRRAPAAIPGIDWRRVGRALSAWLALAAAVALFKVLGFVAGLALLTYFIVAVMYRKPAATAAITAAAVGAGFYLVFDLALGLPLPSGLLGF